MRFCKCTIFALQSRHESTESLKESWRNLAKLGDSPFQFFDRLTRRFPWCWDIHDIGAPAGVVAAVLYTILYRTRCSLFKPGPAPAGSRRSFGERYGRWLPGSVAVAQPGR